MGHKRRMTAEQVEQVRGWLADRWTLFAISRRLRCAPAWLRREIKHAGLTVPPCTGKKGASFRRAHARWEARKLAGLRPCRRCGVHPERRWHHTSSTADPDITLCAHCALLGSRSRDPDRPKVCRLTAEERLAILELHAEGVKIPVIAWRMRRAASTVRYVITLDPSPPGPWASPIARPARSPDDIYRDICNAETPQRVFDLIVEIMTAYDAFGAQTPAARQLAEMVREQLPEMVRQWREVGAEIDTSGAPWAEPKIERAWY